MITADDLDRIEALIAEVRRLNSYGNELQIKRERDAAVAELRGIGNCEHCKHSVYGTPADSPICAKCLEGDDPSGEWEWRGAREAAE